ncbi:restriction endonuclease subunit S [Mucilaginibacter jinjuensis]|uniref:Restriction endonuclease subunit S n=1 Tax=Mucilaginibacter jinjuensis TaxID=1176721 RepID=A0ABY7TCQ8_9SPHI|nr:restriction endonuclease subunit S [Mucilaginibacter jinjuensis]WCT13493.1 restriction endonuclease subunit S [Mucilaginibacter jinjuensis]
MRSHYKKLGPYIQEVNIRNCEASEENLLGVSTQKIFIKSRSNTIGTDFTTYKIIKRNQFTYIADTSRRGDKIAIALLTSQDEAMVSQAYTVFEITDHKELEPEYLMMWFRRPEFDRYARFKSHGSAREIFDWNDMCDIELPIPSIEKQWEIVKEYHTIVNRIELSEKINKKLEETAQALYKQWFVDFEFHNENGKPYKSNGGEMIWCEELKQYVPNGWTASPISSFCDITSSKRIFEDEYVDSGVPFYRGKEISLKKSGTPINDPIYISEHRYIELASRYDIPKPGDILMTAVGTIGVSYLVEDAKFYFKDGNVIWFKNFSTDGCNYFLYDFMQSGHFVSLINEITIGSTQSAITITTFGQQKIIRPPFNIIKEYKSLSYILHLNLQISKEIIIGLHSLKDVLYSKMSKPELLETEQPA